MLLLPSQNARTCNSTMNSGPVKPSTTTPTTTTASTVGNTYIMSATTMPNHVHVWPAPPGVDGRAHQLRGGCVCVRAKAKGRRTRAHTHTRTHRHRICDRACLVAHATVVCTNVRLMYLLRQSATGAESRTMGPGSRPLLIWVIMHSVPATTPPSAHSVCCAHPKMLHKSLVAAADAANRAGIFKMYATLNSRKHPLSFWGGW